MASPIPLPRAPEVWQVAFAYPLEEDLDLLAKLPSAVPRSSFNKQDFIEVVKWKSRRSWTLADKKNSPEQVLAATQEAFAALAPCRSGAALWDEATETLTPEGHTLCESVALLTSRLKQVRLRIASALLTWHSPEHFTVMDRRAYPALCMYVDGLPPSLNLDAEQTYARYLDKCRQLSQTIGVDLRTLDRFLFMIGGSPGSHVEFLAKRREEGYS
jgi:hypothetical protein